MGILRDKFQTLVLTLVLLAIWNSYGWVWALLYLAAIPLVYALGGVLAALHSVWYVWRHR